jgi:hypothetical protein
VTTRTQYLLFISIWVAAIAIGVFIVEAAGLSLGDDARSMRATVFVIGTVAFLPAAAGFALIRGCGSVIDKWRMSRGHDVIGERSYEDEDGFIHLYEVPESMKQHDIGVEEMVNEVADETLGYSDDAK